MTLSDRIHSIWYAGPACILERVLFLLMIPCSLIYAAVMRIRYLLYATGLLKTCRLPRPVISIGNLTVGGTGKTPLTAFIATCLIEKGLRVAVLSRGYGGSREGACAVVSDGKEMFLGPSECGDEPYLLAQSVSGLAVVIGSNRYAAGQMAIECVAPDVFLLDDGFQHIQLHRDLNILLMDCTSPLGNGCVLPAGPLREPGSAAQRADLFIYTRCRHASPPEHSLIPETPYCCVGYRLSRFVQLNSRDVVTLEELQGQSVLAVTGIARPDSFFRGLAAVGIIPAATMALPDHEPYGEATVDSISQKAKQYAATCVVVTSKDGVKLANKADTRLPPVVVAELELDLYAITLLTESLDKLLLKQDILGHTN